MRADERLDEAPPARGALGVLVEHPPELLEMLLERRRDVQEAAVLLEQVVEVQRALLGELGRQHRQHALADDRRLDHRGRVDPDDRDAVRQRVEEVASRLVGDRKRAFGRPDDDVPEPADVDLAPLARLVRMRTDHHP